MDALGLKESPEAGVRGKWGVTSGGKCAPTHATGGGARTSTRKSLGQEVHPKITNPGKKPVGQKYAGD